jgi:exodeoxyribonuclease VII small subunit
MAKTKPANKAGAPAEAEKKAASKKSFEDRLERLEELGDEIRKTDIPLDDAIKAFEEGIKLARDLEKDLEKIESRIEILMNADSAGDDDGEAGEGPVLGLFDDEE